MLSTSDTKYSIIEKNIFREVTDSMKSTGIVICNYNKSDYVANCIQSVLESKTDDYDIYVVDNASTDDSVEKIQTLYGSQVTLLQNKENLGGSGGFNTGIRKVVSAGYKYVWCLDNDVIVDEHALDTLFDFMETHPEVGMTGSKVVHMEDPAVIQQFGLTVDFDNFCVEAKYFNYYDSPEIPEVVYSDAVAACSVLVRTSLIQKIGPMPEENFLYWDDTEWGIRCNLAGYKVASLGTSVVAHAMGQKKESVNTFATYYSWRNWILFFLKYTKEEHLSKLCDTFLGGIFDIIYEGLYRNEENKAKTVMFAYDDALHMRLGKASDGMIFDVDKKDIHLKKLAASYSVFYIEVNGRDALAQCFQTHLLEYAPNAGIIFDTDAGASIPTDACHISLCETIFRQDDLSLTKVYVDENENILLTEDDVLMVINYDYSYRTFHSSQKPLFLHCAEKIQSEFILPFELT